MRDGSARAAAARACVGARFRLHGRHPALGLDCAGVAAIAFARDVPATYRLRGGDPARVGAAIARAGLRPVSAPDAGTGDLLLLGMGAGQLHLAVLTANGFVHADARLRRVVETPGRPGVPVLGAWTEEG